MGFSSIVSSGVRVVLILGLLLWVFRPPQSAPEPLKRAELLMDTLVSAAVYAPPDQASAGMHAAFEQMRLLDEMASFHKPTSQLAQLNCDHRLVPTASFALLLEAASQAAHLSSGVFDPSFAVLHRAYGFYDKKGRVPDASEVASLLPSIGWGNQVASINGEIQLASGALLDLGGIAGGFAITAAIAAFHSASCSSFFIDDGGDLWMEGPKPNGEPWRIGVRDPRTDGFLARIETRIPTAISTSGDYERFVEVDGKRYGHIMVPATGRPADFYRSVTVVASTPVQADILSTTLFAMHPEHAREFCVRTGLPALFLPASGTTWMSPAGQSWFQDVAP